jgi:tagatose-1,6-bisphosphate aldolase non-catalytic subunit AgaZ/GatZ
MLASAMTSTPREKRPLPGNWRKYYQGDADELRLQRHFSFSDRIRYYWAHPEAQAAVNRLFAKLDDKVIPEPLISQYLGGLYPEVVDGSLSAVPENLCSEPCFKSCGDTIRRPVIRKRRLTA